MGLRAESKYRMTVERGGWIESDRTGASGFQVDMTCEDGPITAVIWVTEKSREMAEKQFAALGVNAERLKDYRFMNYELPQEVIGREVVVKTKEEEYKGKVSVKVAALYPPNAPSGGDGGAARSAVSIFGGTAVVENRPDTTGANLQAPLTDDDIPF